MRFDPINSGGGGKCSTQETMPAPRTRGERYNDDDESKVYDKGKRRSRHIFQPDSVVNVRLFFHPPLVVSPRPVTRPYVGRSIPDEMEYRYAGHPEGSVVNIEKFLPERKKDGRASEKKRGRKRGEREREREGCAL